MSAVKGRCFKDRAVISGTTSDDQTTCDYFGCESDAKCGDPLDDKCGSSSKLGINEASDLMNSSIGRSYLRAAGCDA